MVFNASLSHLYFAALLFCNKPQLTEQLEAFSCWRRKPSWGIVNEPLERSVEIHFSIYSGIPISQTPLDSIFRTSRVNSSQKSFSSPDQSNTVNQFSLLLEAWEIGIALYIFFISNMKKAIKEYSSVSGYRAVDWTRIDAQDWTINKWNLRKVVACPVALILEICGHVGHLHSSWQLFKNPECTRREGLIWSE